MGGICIVGAVLVGFLSAHVIPGVHWSRSGALVMLAIVGAAAIGFADDWIKVRHRRSLGLNKRAKFGAQMALGVLVLAPGRLLGPRLDHALVHPVQLDRAAHGHAPSGWCGAR